MTLPQRRNSDVLREFVEIEGRTIVDIGCGDGKLVAWLRKHGARAIGIDPQAKLLKENAVAATAEALPFADAGLDTAILFNSLHHVPSGLMTRALDEAARVARSEIAVFEPIASGSWFELVREVDDETQVRAEAYDAIKRSSTLKVTAEYEWEYASIYSDFRSVVKVVCQVDPARRARMDAMHNELERRFLDLGREVEGGRALDQPMRLNLLKHAP